MMVNDISIRDEDAVILTEYIIKNSSTWNIFMEFLSEKPILIRKEILNLVPKTGFFFNGTFIELLKFGKGVLFAEVNTYFR